MRERFESLQVLRGVACLLVVAYHVAGLAALFGLGFDPTAPLRWFGYAGVDLFFVLSGFIITATCRGDLGRPARLPAYLVRRAWRIFPTYWAAALVGAAVFAGLSPTPLVRPGWEKELTDTVLLLPQASPPRVLGVAWTLSFELMFYAGFAALFLLPRRAAPVALAAWAAAVVGCKFAGAAPANRFAALALSPFVLEFLAGSLVAAGAVRLSRRRAGGVLAAALAWVAVGSAVAYHPNPVTLGENHWGRAAVFGVPAALAVFALTAWERGGGRVRRGWLSATGDASYSIYLIHGPVMTWAMYLTMLAGWSHTRVWHVAWLVVMTAVSVVPGFLLHRYVEAPLLRLGKRKRPADVTPEQSCGRTAGPPAPKVAA